MATMNISLTDNLKAYVEERANSGLYAGASDYVRDLIRQDRERQEKLARMQELWTEGLESGISEKTVEEVFEEARQRHLNKKKNNCRETGTVDSSRS